MPQPLRDMCALNGLSLWLDFLVKLFWEAGATPHFPYLILLMIFRYPIKLSICKNEYIETTIALKKRCIVIYCTFTLCDELFTIHKEYFILIPIWAHRYINLIRARWIVFRIHCAERSIEVIPTQ